MPHSILGFDIQDSKDAIERREAAYKKMDGNPRTLPAFADEDVPILVGLGILYRRRDGTLARHPLFPTTNEDIIQFFRWAVGEDKHPLPPLVRRILCMRREILQASVESFSTTPILRTGQLRMLAQIETLLENDGVKDVDAACSGKEAQTVKGAWAQPTLTIDLGALKGPTCDYTSLQAQLERLGNTLATLEPSDTVRPEVMETLDALLSTLGSLLSSVGTGSDSETVRGVLKGLETSVQNAKQSLEAANSRQVKARLETLFESLKPALTSLGPLMDSLKVAGTQKAKEITQLQQAPASAQAATGTNNKNAEIAKLQTSLQEALKAKEAETQLGEQKAQEIQQLQEALDAAKAAQAATGANNKNAEIAKLQTSLRNLQTALTSAEAATKASTITINKPGESVTLKFDQIINQINDLQETIEKQKAEIERLKAGNPTSGGAKRRQTRRRKIHASHRRSRRQRK